MININEQKISKLKDVQYILDNNGSVTIQLGIEPYSDPAVPLEWKAVDNDGETLMLLSVKVIGIENYMNGLEWLVETVLKENFTCDERTLIISHNGQHFFFSNAYKIQEYTGSDLSAEQTDLKANVNI